MNNHPIGIFDSGIGGLTIWKEVRKALPGEPLIYLADSRNAPYGERSRSEIIELSVRNTRFLMEKGCKLIVVACNTATTNAITYLRSHFDIPFIGIEPAIKPAGLNSATGAIGVLATRGTLSSALFSKTSKTYLSHIKVIEQFGDGIVPLIESGRIDSDEMRDLLQGYLAPMLENNIDHLVLGCTHYPLLISVLKTILPENVRIIDSGAAVARQTRAVLEAGDLLHVGKEETPQLQFYTNGDMALIQEFIQESSQLYMVHRLNN